MGFEIRFKDESLEKLQREDAGGDKAYPSGVARAFRKRLQLIRSAGDERDFYSLRSNRFERLQGKREHQYSMRLNDQWRLILEMEGDGPKKTVWIVAIEDYH
jgi:proteic killer suppression protein